MYTLEGKLQLPVQGGAPAVLFSLAKELVEVSVLFKQESMYTPHLRSSGQVR